MTVDEKASVFQSMLVEKYHGIFKLKEVKVSDDDRPWYSDKLKALDRIKRREFEKHQKSDRWRELNKEYKEAVKKEKGRFL